MVRPRRKAPARGRSGRSARPAAMNSCAEGSGENTNTAKLATTPVLLFASVWPSASRLTTSLRTISKPLTRSRSREPPAGRRDRGGGEQGADRARRPRDRELLVLGEQADQQRSDHRAREQARHQHADG